MNKIDRINWVARTEKLNLGKTLAIGDRVIDIDKNRGVVVKIMPGYDIEDHGAIFVWQSNRTGYGDDNCEHYAFVNWAKYLRIEN